VPKRIAAIALIAFFRLQAQQFDVVSLKPSAAGRPIFVANQMHGGPGTSAPTRLTAIDLSVKFMLIQAYGVSAFQIVGPDWIDPPPRSADGRFDLTANLPTATTKDQLRLMWQNLLKDRFGLTLHHEPREMPVRALVVVKGGPKLSATSIDPNAPAADPRQLAADGVPVRNGCIVPSSSGIQTYSTSDPRGAQICHSFRSQSMQQFAAFLSDQFHVPVIDKTDLRGFYDFSWDYRIGINLDARRAADLETELGLRLVPADAQVDTLIVDTVDRAPHP
jgi:uncharacterized protein (TIGR03435 family)